MGTASFCFSGEVAIVTGAAAGIGREIARRLAAAGALVHGVDVNPPAALRAEDVGITWYQLDLRESGAVEELVAEIHSVNGHIDHLVNNAGILGTVRFGRWTTVIGAPSLTST